MSKNKALHIKTRQQEAVPMKLITKWTAHNETFNY